MGHEYFGIAPESASDVEKVETEFDLRIKEIIDKVSKAMEEFRKARDLYHVAQTNGTSLEIRAQLEIDLNNKTMAVHRLWDALEKIRISLGSESSLN